MFRFTIRDVLWLMVVVGLTLGWWLEHRFQEDRFQALRTEVSAGWAEGTVPIEVREQMSHEAVGRAIGVKIPENYGKWRRGED